MKKTWTLRSDAGEVIDSFKLAARRIAALIARAADLQGVKDDEEKTPKNSGITETYGRQSPPLARFHLRDFRRQGGGRGSR